MINKPIFTKDFFLKRTVFKYTYNLYSRFDTIIVLSFFLLHNQKPTAHTQNCSVTYMYIAYT